MNVSETTTISVRGKVFSVPVAMVRGVSVVVSPGWGKIARVHDEEWHESDALADPSAFLAELKALHVKADIFTFSQTPTDPFPRYSYVHEWDNAAVIPINTFEDWWERRLPQESRRNVRIAAKRGVVVRSALFDDRFVQGIVNIYNETPVRQGRPFWHYGKDFETVKRENATYLDRSEFIGAYLNDELIGFIKMVYVGKRASIMQILAQNSHADKRTMNALIAEAVKASAFRGMRQFVYCKYVYSNDRDNSLTEFKRRNGFEEVRYPRYYVPLTPRGRLVVAMGLYRDLPDILPGYVVSVLRKVRQGLYKSLHKVRTCGRES
jgi:hypothetical protein